MTRKANNDGIFACDAQTICPWSTRSYIKELARQCNVGNRSEGSRNAFTFLTTRTDNVVDDFTTNPPITNVNLPRFALIECTHALEGK